jgi:hypothetical protein
MGYRRGFVPNKFLSEDLLARNRIAFWNPASDATTALAFGMLAPTNTGGGTFTARTVTTSSLFTSTRRLGIVSTATAGNTAHMRCGSNFVWRGNAAGRGGFKCIFRFGISDAALVADARTFVGLATGGILGGAITPSALTNFVGIAHDATQTTFRIMHNGVATATTVDLGSSFPSNTTNTDLYELYLYAEPHSGVSAPNVYWEVTRLNTGRTARGTTTGNLPSDTTTMTPHFYRSNGTTAAATGIDMLSCYIETPI